MSDFRIQIVINFNVLFDLWFINIHILDILFFVIIVIIFFYKLVILLFIAYFNRVVLFLVTVGRRTWWSLGCFFLEKGGRNFFEHLKKPEKSILLLFLVWVSLEIMFDVLFKSTLWSLSEITILLASIFELTHIP